VAPHAQEHKMNPLIIGVGLAALTALIVRHLMQTSSTPFSIADIEHSDTAKKFGIENKIPSHLIDQARGLGIVAGRVRGKGYRINSLFRSPELNGLIHALNQARAAVGGRALTDAEEQNAFNNATSKIGPHTLVTAFDCDKLGHLKASKAEMQPFKEALLRDPEVSPFIKSILVEGDHMHVECFADKLSALGRKNA
jgi:hypothetical protein